MTKPSLSAYPVSVFQTAGTQPPTLPSTLLNTILLCQALKHILTPSAPPLKVHAHQLHETESQEDHHATGSAISLPPAGLGALGARLRLCCSTENLCKASGRPPPLKGGGIGTLRSRTPATLIFHSDSECPAQEGHWTPGCPQIGMPRLVDVFACVSGVKEWKLWPRFGRKFSRIMLSLT